MREQSRDLPGSCAAEHRANQVRGKGREVIAFAGPGPSLPTPTRKRVSRPQRAPFIAAHARQDVRRAAAENFWNIYAAGDGDIRARAAQPLAELQNGARPRLDRPCSSRPAHHRVSDRTPRRSPRTHVPASNRTWGPINVTSSVAMRRIIPQQAVRQAMRVPVHRAADRHAARLKSPSAQVLHRREHARDAEWTTQPSLTRRRTSRGRRLFNRNGSRSRRIEHLRRCPADDAPPARRIAGIDARLRRRRCRPSRRRRAGAEYRAAASRSARSTDPI